MENFIISKNDILSSLAYCAIRQSPYNYPENLLNALQDVSNYLDNMGIFKSTAKHDYDSYLHVNEKYLLNLITQIIKNVLSVSIWNVSKVEQNNGISDPNDTNRTNKHAFVSRYSYPTPDYDFIDLDALIRNTFNMIESIEKK